MSIICKIIIQIQAKLGGVPWAFEIEDLDVFKKEPTMVIGYDRFDSIVSVCATMDRNYC